MPDATFPPAMRIRKRTEFERVYALKTKAADGVLLLFAAKRSELTTRIGLSVSKKHGGAIIRNQLKRLLREAFRLEQHQLPPTLDLIAIPLSAERASLAAYRQSLVHLARRLAKRLDRPPPVPDAQP